MAATGSREGLERWLPLYEAKMIHIYDPKWATYKHDGTIREVTSEEKADLDFHVMPRYWVPEPEVNDRLPGWSYGWLLGWRDITNSTNERTIIVSMLPRAGVGNKLPLMLLDVASRHRATVLEIALGTLACDFVVRQKLGGVTLNFFILKQISVPHCDLVLAAVAAITKMEPIEWLLERRQRIGCAVPRKQADARADLEALFFRTYGLSRKEVEHVLESFLLVRQREEAALGRYQTAERILERYDAQVLEAAPGSISASQLA
jgi:hypothetical protein